MTFTQFPERILARARRLAHLRDAPLDAVVSARRAVDDITGAHRVAWWTMQAVINAATLRLTVAASGALDAVRGAAIAMIWLAVVAQGAHCAAAATSIAMFTRSAPPS